MTVGSAEAANQVHERGTTNHKLNLTVLGVTYRAKITAYLNAVVDIRRPA
jgi:hypothetical protein